MIYLLSPYSHETPAIRHLRHRQTASYVAQCISKGENVYSPIVHNHHLAEVYGMPTAHDAYTTINEDMMDRCDSARLLMLPGWEDSRGINDHEIPYLNMIGKPIERVEAS